MASPYEGRASSALLEHAKRLHSLLTADVILEYLCREVRALAGAELVAGSAVAMGEAWQRGLHLLVDEDCHRAPPAAVSAGFAVYRRLSAALKPVDLAYSEDIAPIFRGYAADDDPHAVLCALPLLNRRTRLLGQIVLVLREGGYLDPYVRAGLLDLVSLSALALESAQRLALARQDQDRLQLLAEATEEALWDWDLQSDQFWWGGGIQHVLRSGSERIGSLGSWKLERVHPEDRASVEAIIAAARQGDDSTWRADYRFRRGDGTWARVEDRGYLLRDASGRAYRMLGSLRDVSWEKWIEQQQQFLVDASSELAASQDVEANLATVAHRAVATVADACAILLLPSEGRPASIVLHHCDAARAESAKTLLEPSLGQALSLLTQQKTAVVLDFPGARALLAPCPSLAEALDLVQPHSLLYVPLVTAGTVLGGVVLAACEVSRAKYTTADLAFAEEFARRCGVAVDKARLYEQAQQAIHARDSFMAILGHELRNPLSPITTALHLMKLRDPRGTREQEVISRQVQHLTRLIDDLLDVSRIERGKLELARKPVQMAEIVASAMEIASPLIEQRNHRLELDVPATGLPLLADQTRMAQVVANLLTNAARYTDEGGQIWIRAWRASKQVVLSVRDNGMGIPPELLARVFDLFVQGPRAADRRQGGLGLGLSLVQRLVAFHGGTVEAHSDGPGKGSEFVVRVPVLPMEIVQGTSLITSQEQSEESTRRRVLIVDDNTDAAELLRELLLARGHEVLVAHDGPGAIAAAPGFDPEIAVLDIGLPVMDGYELARRLLAALPHPPLLVALTGYGQEQDRRYARQAGFDHHLVKPVNPAQMIRLIEGHSTARNARGAL